MKTSEFKEKLKDYSLHVGETEVYFTLSYYGACIADVSKTRQGNLSIYSMPFKQLVYTLIDYAETPISEREDEKKYTVILPDPKNTDSHQFMLTKRLPGVCIGWCHTSHLEPLTEAEIKKNHEYLWQFAKEVKE